MKKFENGEIIDADETNAQHAVAYAQGILNLIRQLEDREVTFSVLGGEWAEAYTSAAGRLGSVDTVNTTAIFDTDRYFNIDVILTDIDDWTVPSGVTNVDVLVVAGGGGAGKGTNLSTQNGGGGGAGGLIFIEDYDISGYGGTIPYSVGTGGAGSTDVSNKGVNGVNTTFGNLTAIGGGGGGSRDNRDGVDGGSGGGAGVDGSNTGTGGASTQTTTNDGYAGSGFGNAGANSTSGTAGGGGGAETAGSGINGGAGKDFAINSAKGGGAHDSGTDARANRGDGGRAQAINSTANGRPGSDGVIAIIYPGSSSDITHDLPSNLIPSDVTSAFGYAKIAKSAWKDGANVQFKLTNAVPEDSGWINIKDPIDFTAFTSEPTKCVVKLTGYVGINGFGIKTKDGL